MNNFAWAGQWTPLVAIAVGVLLCFGGYRILKLSLGLLGFVAGAAAGWQVGLSLVHDNTAIALGCAIVVGVLGAVLCLWLYFFGIFILGASAGAVVAAGLFNGTGHQAEPILLLVFAVVFGLLALLAQKVMVILSTALSGSYLVTAGILPFVAGNGNKTFPMWFNPAQAGSTGTLGYGAVAFWLLLAIVGAAFQFRVSRRKVEVEVERK